MFKDIHACSSNVVWNVGLEVPCEYLFEGDSFSCGGLQVKLIKEEFDVHCGEPSKAN